MLKIFFYTLAAFFIAAPIGGWAYLVALACGYQTGPSSCGIQLADFWDTEFLTIAALPWLLGIFFLLMGIKRR